MIWIVLLVVALIVASFYALVWLAFNYERWQMERKQGAKRLARG